jgi:hypothetical protein
MYSPRLREIAKEENGMNASISFPSKKKVDANIDRDCVIEYRNLARRKYTAHHREQVDKFKESRRKNHQA